MNAGFYPKLAWNGIRKNKKLYLPYLLTCTGMITIFYILAFLSENRATAGMRAGNIVQYILSLGTWVIGAFSLIFLFYTNSFLIRKRKKEFGLYNILGMGKRNLAIILLWETLIVAGISLICGLCCGVLLSKAAELCLTNILNEEITLTFSVEPKALVNCALLFSAIFILILLNTLRQIRVAKPIELLHSESVGEKPPKANWFLAILGAVILAAAYTIALMIDNPIQAILNFFLAVILVIIGTYILFVSGSVALCKLLQKNKNYYYKTNHFVSVSSMLYRMKRNGAGLASICILSTMILVMVSSTVCLFVGTENSLKEVYPRDIIISTENTSQPEPIKHIAADILKEKQAEPKDEMEYRELSFTSYLENGTLILDTNSIQNISFTNLRLLCIYTLEDYNRILGKEETLGENEVLLHTSRTDFAESSIRIEGCPELQIKKTVDDYIPDGEASTMFSSSLFLIVPDAETMEQISRIQAEAYGKNASEITDYYAFNLNLNDKKQIEIYEEIFARMKEEFSKTETPYHFQIKSLANERPGHYELNGGFFFLGIFLGLIFLAATVLIMYYKQISEGYEDQSKFEIMQKVGMTKKEIRKSINSQILTVFFLPLIAAGVHTALAFPIISKMLMLFSIENTPLLAGSTFVTYLIFAVFYIFVYRITSRAYYGIVSGRKEDSV